MIKQLITTIAFSCAVATAAYSQFAGNEKIVVGEPAPELEFAQPDGTILKLSELNQGRVVLIDFWASWCGPCRNANPKLVAMYKAYQGKKFQGAKKGFTVLSVSLDQKKEKWLAAIAADSLIWPYHISDLGGWNSKPAEIYGVQFIPQAILVGPDGVVLAKYNFAEQAEGELQKLVIVKKKRRFLFF